ncbi:MAG: SPOR domain-containing protein [Prevotella sp.]|nr:SPOR domain-containing protein [Prevotella sp.]
MKKYTVLCAGLCLALAFTSCKSSESAYKKAYEKAKQYDTAQQQPQQPVAQAPVETPAVVAPVQTKPVTETRVYDNADNVSVRKESVSLVSGSGLKAFSVVVGSFGLVSNAEGLQQNLRDAGYDAQIVKNEDRNMYRVIASTFDNKADAVRSRDQFRAQEAYKDAWLLSNQ